MYVCMLTCRPPLKLPTLPMVHYGATLQAATHQCLGQPCQVGRWHLLTPKTTSAHIKSAFIPQWPLEFPWGNEEFLQFRVPGHL